MLPGVAFFQRWFKSLQKPKITYSLGVLECTFIGVLYLLHYYDILLADAFLQKQTLKAQEQDITNKKTLLVHNKYSKSA